MRLRYIAFVSVHLIALLAVCIIKFCTRPVQTEIIRTSIMTKSEKDELISGVLTVLSTNKLLIAATNNNQSAVDISPRSVDGNIYLANGEYIYRTSAGFDFYVGDLCPFDCKPILAIYKQCFQTSGGFFLVGGSSLPSGGSSSRSVSVSPTFGDIGIKL